MSDQQIETGGNGDSAGQALAEVGTKKRRIDTYFRTVGAVNGSDIHLKSDAVPRVRVSGDLRTLKT